MLYAFGSNGAGQLNVGHDTDLSSPTPCLLAPARGASVRIIGGGNHTFVEIDDRVFLVGNDEPMYAPEQGIRSSRSGVLEFTNVRSFAATWDAFAVVARDADDGRGQAIRTFGSAEKGQLGRSSASNLSGDENGASHAVSLPKGLGHCSVVDVAGGVQHFVAVLDSGEAIGWGNGRKGQLGFPEGGVVEEPRKIEGVGFRIRKAFCGREFTYLLGDPKTGEHAVLGSDKFGVKSQAPALVKGWKSAGVNWGGVSVLLEDGKVLSWGRNNHGQLAPDGLPLLADIAVGSEHTVALSREGNVLVWGWGEHGNCGAGVDDGGDVKGRWNEVSLPETSRREVVAGLGAGCATSWIWTETGE